MRHAISRNLLLSGAVVAAVLACRSRGAREPSAAPGGASDASVPPAAGQPSPEPRTRVSEALDTTGCSFVARQLHPQPRELVDEFLRRDADGEFVSPGDWYFSALMCGGRGGTDRATLITSYRLDSLRVGPDTAIYRVRYAVQGSLDQDANGFFSPYANFFNDFGGGQTLNQAIRPYPQYFGMVDNFDLSGVDHYNALQTQIQKRFSGGVSFLVAYTLSKTMSNADSGFSTFDENPVNKFNKKQLWSIAGDDRTHVLNISGIYELPIGPGKQLLGHSSGPLAKNLLSGWQFSGVFQYASNTPMRIGANGSPLRTGNIANVVSGQPLSVDYNNYYKGLPVFNIGAFSSPGRFAVGDAPRRIDGFRGAFTGNENLALAKHFYFSERVSAELRMEFYNVLNRMQICNPDSRGANNVDSANFGIINGGSVCQNNSPRQGQAFFKVSF